MWCYKLKFYEDGCCFNAEGIVAGLSIADAIERLKGYYGENAVEDIHITHVEDYDGVLDSNEFPNVKYTTFFPEEN